jgi:hypothetical protein
VYRDAILLGSLNLKSTASMNSSKSSTPKFARYPHCRGSAVSAFPINGSS